MYIYIIFSLRQRLCYFVFEICYEIVRIAEYRTDAGQY